MKSKKAAFEMSVGAIVTVVLSVTLLVGGILIITKIVNTTTSVVDLTTEQLTNQINKLFSEESKISIYPSTRFVEIKQEKIGGVGFGIRNLLTGASADKTFSYTVIVSDADIQSKCGINAGVAEGWITTGRAEDNMAISAGDFAVGKILFEIPTGSPLCTIRFRINVDAGGTAYATDSFDVQVKAK